MTITQEEVTDAVVDRPYYENSARVLVPQTLVQTRRILLRWSRDLTTVIEALVLPVLFLMTLNIVLGQLISQFTGHSAPLRSMDLRSGRSASSASAPMVCCVDCGCCPCTVRRVSCRGSSLRRSGS